MGVRIVEVLAERLGIRLKKVRLLAVIAGEQVADGERLFLARPLTFMNESGPPIASLARKRKVDVEHVVACHDEIDLPLGSLKIKRGGSTAGHRGLESLRSSLRSGEFHRVRVGVGRPPGRKDPADHVLERFSKAEREEIEVVIEEAADAVLTLARDGLATAQDRHNRTGRP